MEIYISLMGVQNAAGFWKTTPREIYALWEIAHGKTQAQARRGMVNLLGEGVC